ncbi:hypothetical protein V8E52_007716 [Russula decolorans]|jgi:hypothetical protein
MDGSFGLASVRIVILYILFSDLLTTLNRFGAYFDPIQVYMTANDPMELAQLKLLNCQGPLPIPEMSQDGILACLSACFALEFDLSVPSTRRIKNTRVERHLRRCLDHTGSHRLDCFLTVAGSEPYLEQAAAELMQLNEKTTARLLVEHQDLGCVKLGLMWARDTAFEKFEPRIRLWWVLGNQRSS